MAGSDLFQLKDGRAVLTAGSLRSRLNWPRRAWKSQRRAACQEADVIVALLPSQDNDCAQVLHAHRRLWNSRLAS